MRDSANAVVYVAAIPGKTFPAPAEHARIDQKNMVFSPHVLPISVGTTVDFLNSDAVLHNVFSPDACADQFNLGTWPKGQSKSFTFKQECVATLLCKVHPEMEGFVVALPTPYFAVTKADGAYAIAGVPDGAYTVKVWHPKLKAAQKAVTVAGATAGRLRDSRSSARGRRAGLQPGMAGAELPLPARLPGRHTRRASTSTLIAEGKFREAYAVARRPNPLASICGRICAAPCEAVCRRGELDAPIAIRALKRFVTERFGVESMIDFSVLAEIYGRRTDRYPERVAVIGSGPAGLACAHDLALLGYPVTIFEAAPVAGGMLRLGVPEYRLPRALIQLEINAILSLGVELRTNVRLGRDFSLADLRAPGLCGRSSSASAPCSSRDLDDAGRRARRRAERHRLPAQHQPRLQGRDGPAGGRDRRRQRRPRRRAHRGARRRAGEPAAQPVDRAGARRGAQRRPLRRPRGDRLLPGVGERDAGLGRKRSRRPRARACHFHYRARAQAHPRRGRRRHRRRAARRASRVFDETRPLRTRARAGLGDGDRRPTP